MPMTKLCKSCSKELPETEFYFDRGRRASPCRQCRSAKDRQRREGRSPEEREKESTRRAAKHARLSAEERKARVDEARAWRRANPAEARRRMREQWLRAEYGIGVAEVEAILVAQGGGCAVCGFSDRSNPKMFPHVDHCHQTGKVRGVVCNNCNVGMGHFRDDPALIRAAMAYLSPHAEERDQPILPLGRAA